MNQSDEIDKVAAALAAATAATGAVEMTGWNADQKYRYASDDDLARAVQPALAANGLSIVQVGIRPTFTDIGKTSSGAPKIRCDATVYYRIVHASGQWIGAVGYGQGWDYADKMASKAQTGAFKYLLRTLFCIPCGDDVTRADDGGDGKATRTAGRADPRPSAATRQAAPARTPAAVPSQTTAAPAAASGTAVDPNAGMPWTDAAAGAERPAACLTDAELSELSDEQLRAELKSATAAKSPPAYVANVAGLLNQRIKRAHDAAAA